MSPLIAPMVCTVAAFWLMACSATTSDKPWAKLFSRSSDRATNRAATANQQGSAVESSQPRTSEVLFNTDAYTALPPRNGVPNSVRSRALVGRAKHRLAARMDDRGFRLGQPVFLRIFKNPRVLEVWLKRGDRFDLFESYLIQRFAGGPGPKISDRDGQSPEGFYQVTRYRMNPYSFYHLGFNLGYPNAHDRGQGWTGQSVMIHGKETSRGCYAMGDEAIEEIYALCESALEAGQDSFSVQCLPFPLNSHNMQVVANHPWAAFWATLEPGFRYFEEHRTPPAIGTMANGSYILESAEPQARRFRGLGAVMRD